MDYCIIKQQQHLVISLCPTAVHAVKHLGHDCRLVLVWRQMAKTNRAHHGVERLKRLTSLCKTLLHDRRWQLFLLAFKAFFALPTSQCSTYLGLFFDVFGFRALHTCQRTALVQSGFGDVVWRAVCSRSLELHARRWPPHEPSGFSPCQES